MSGHNLGPRPLHLPRIPRRPRRSSWPTRWRPEWRPGTTTSLSSGPSARSKCCRRDPEAGPALSFVWPRGPRSPSWSAPRLRASTQSRQQSPGTRASARTRRALRPVTPRAAVGTAPQCLVSLASWCARAAARPQTNKFRKWKGPVGKMTNLCGALATPS